MERRGREIDHTPAARIVLFSVRILAAHLKARAQVSHRCRPTTEDRKGSRTRVTTVGRQESRAQNLPTAVHQFAQRPELGVAKNSRKSHAPALNESTARYVFSR